MTKAELESKATDLLEKCQFLTLSSVTDEGYPRVCSMAKMKNEGFSVIWFSTGSGSVKVANFRRNARAGVCYYDESDSVTVIGEVEIVDDPEFKREQWADWMLDFFPGGIEDPEYCVLKFTGKEATFWLEKQFETHAC